MCVLNCYQTLDAAGKTAVLQSANTLLKNSNLDEMNEEEFQLFLGECSDQMLSQLRPGSPNSHANIAPETLEKMLLVSREVLIKGIQHSKQTYQSPNLHQYTGTLDVVMMASNIARKNGFDFEGVRSILNRLEPEQLIQRFEAVSLAETLSMFDRESTSTNLSTAHILTSTRPDISDWSGKQAFCSGLGVATILLKLYDDYQNIGSAFYNMRSAEGQLGNLAVAMESDMNQLIDELRETDDESNIQSLLLADSSASVTEQAKAKTDRKYWTLRDITVKGYHIARAFDFNKDPSIESRIETVLGEERQVPLVELCVLLGRVQAREPSAQTESLIAQLQIRINETKATFLGQGSDNPEREQKVDAMINLVCLYGRTDGIRRNASFDVSGNMLAIVRDSVLLTLTVAQRLSTGITAGEIQMAIYGLKMLNQGPAKIYQSVITDAVELTDSDKALLERVATPDDVELSVEEEAQLKAAFQKLNHPAIRTALNREQYTSAQITAPLKALANRVEQHQEATDAVNQTLSQQDLKQEHFLQNMYGHYFTKFTFSKGLVSRHSHYEEKHQKLMRCYARFSELQKHYVDALSSGAAPGEIAILVARYEDAANKLMQHSKAFNQFRQETISKVGNQADFIQHIKMQLEKSEIMASEIRGDLTNSLVNLFRQHCAITGLADDIALLDQDDPQSSILNPAIENFNSLPVVAPR